MVGAHCYKTATWSKCQVPELSKQASNHVRGAAYPRGKNFCPLVNPQNSLHTFSGYGPASKHIQDQTGEYIRTSFSHIWYSILFIAGVK